ncbi:CAP domain-containing protein [Jannaschia sp. Os4]|uniref:CAP domain-containing protein n=1 Tax=Jannaschia sp. Os4 TaxID=2807617 RepID=UPI00193935A8|nr:CAP domain-containing protein [Jannaschia sp. Os4]MBM2576101.1 CAP domain-containing protein [Jannaschia sp. Os4]
MRFVLSLLLCLLALPAAARDVSAEALALASRERAAAGLPPLAADPALARAALDQAARMARRGRLGHDGAGGLGARLRAAGAGGCRGAENVGMGMHDPRHAVRAWMGSRGHRANLMSPAMTRGAVAWADGGGRRWWAMVLSGPC